MTARSFRRHVPPNLLRRLAPLCCLALLGTAGHGVEPRTAPVAGLRDNTPQTHALVGAKLNDARSQIAELTAFTADLQATAAQLAAEPVDGACGDGCACITDDAALATGPVSVQLSPRARADHDVPIACSLGSGDMAQRLADWQAVTDATGQPFKRDGALPDGFVYDTEPACRAIVTARSLAPDCAWKLLGLIQRAFYVEGRDVTLAHVLVELAEQAGIPRIEFAGEFDRADQHAATAADFTWVQDLGIAGFPTLLAERNGQLALLTNGYQPLSELSPLLARWLERAACV